VLDALLDYDTHIVVFPDAQGQLDVGLLDPYGDLTPDQRGNIRDWMKKAGYNPSKPEVGISRASMPPPPLRVLPGEWKVTIHVDDVGKHTGNVHAWISYERNGNKYTIGAVTGFSDTIEWNDPVDLKRPSIESRSKMVKNPVVFPRPSFTGMASNCVLYARVVWWATTNEDLGAPLIATSEGVLAGMASRLLTRSMAIAAVASTLAEAYEFLSPSALAKDIRRLLTVAE
jgi:hypothetical protein